MPTLANNVVLFCHKIAFGYDNKNNLISEEQKMNPYVKKTIEAFDISKIENDETFYKLMLNIYKLLNELISLIGETNPE